MWVGQRPILSRGRGGVTSATELWKVKNHPIYFIGANVPSFFWSPPSSQECLALASWPVHSRQLQKFALPSHSWFSWFHCFTILIENTLKSERREVTTSLVYASDFGVNVPPVGMRHSYSAYPAAGQRHWVRPWPPGYSLSLLVRCLRRDRHSRR